MGDGWATNEAAKRFTFTKPGSLCWLTAYELCVFLVDPLGKTANDSLLMRAHISLTYLRFLTQRLLNS